MPKGSKTGKLVRQRRVEQLLEAGFVSGPKIVEKLAEEGIKATVRTIQRDILEIEKEFRARTVGIRASWKWRQVLDAQERKRLLRAAWHRSEQAKERSRQKETRPGESGDGGTGRVEIEATTEGRLPQVAYLRKERENDQFIARLIGTEEPRTLHLTADEIDEAIDDELARLARGGQGPAAPEPTSAGNETDDADRPAVG
jgi:hypothetical protein